VCPTPIELHFCTEAKPFINKKLDNQPAKKGENDKQ
jgi:hypothetical protein